MKGFSRYMQSSLALVVAGFLAAGPAIADKPSWAGSDKGGKKEQRSESRGDRRDDRREERREVQERSRQGDERSSGAQRRHFEPQHQVLVRDYYHDQFRGGRCPPGLAKKHNGCLPPGQAKKWQVGRPLPREVIYYNVPQPLVVQIGLPPSGYRYVRVAGDILMIAIGTGLVVDAIQDLGRN
jgi:Ni/Co efflux regulator RcnB